MCHDFQVRCLGKYLNKLLDLASMVGKAIFGLQFGREVGFEGFVMGMYISFDFGCYSGQIVDSGGFE